MRTHKILALSAVAGALASTAAMAQSTNVYSQNIVGYINVTLYPGYNIVTCPLICSPDNTLNTLFNNSNGQYQILTGVSRGHNIYNSLQAIPYINGTGYGNSDYANNSAGSSAGGWQSGGTATLLPGQAMWLLNPQTNGVGSTSNMLATFVGTVPTGLTTNILYPGFNLAGSAVPMSGDLVTNTISDWNQQAAGSTLSLGPTSGDTVYVYDPTPAVGGGQGGYGTGAGGDYNTPRHGSSSWNVNGATDPATATVYEGFWYFSAATANNNWVENFSVNP